jgi:hypothetical protein
MNFPFKFGDLSESSGKFGGMYSKFGGMYSKFGGK